MPPFDTVVINTLFLLGEHLISATHANFGIRFYTTVEKYTLPGKFYLIIMQNWLQANCSGSLKLSRFEPTGLAHLDCVWGVMLDKHHKLQTKPKMTGELKAALQ